MQAAFDHSMTIRGDATFFEVFGNHPDLYRWYTESFYGQVFRGGLVERRIKELVRLRLSTIHGCRFCNQGNRVDALDAGLDAADIDALADYEDSSLAPREKAALRLADQMLLTNPAGSLSTELHAGLSQYFSDAEILELGLVMGILSGMAKFLFAYDLVEKENNCPI
jgi:AhpD family alkylhydroperoxidase